MSTKCIFIDTSRCTACRACQVACKQWKGFGVVPTKQTGTHQNPPDFTHLNNKIVRFSEHKIDGRIHWLFFPDQCRHCLLPGCKMTADVYVDDAIVVDEETGIVVCTEKCKELTEEQCEEVIESCPYDVPRRDPDTGMLSKCDMCIDRVHAGLIPMCVKTCCTGAMNFGDREDMLKLAEEHLEKVKKEHPNAELLDVEELAVIFLVTQPRDMYHDFADRRLRPLDRGQFLANLTKPFKNIVG
jgi:formate dehydrogenase iron-sulfur subunit